MPTGFCVASIRASPAEVKKSLSHSTQSLSGYIWNAGSVLVPAMQKKMWTGWREPREGPQ